MRPLRRALTLPLRRSSRGCHRNRKKNRDQRTLRSCRKPTGKRSQRQRGLASPIGRGCAKKRVRPTLLEEREKDCRFLLRAIALRRAADPGPGWRAVSPARATGITPPAREGQGGSTKGWGWRRDGERYRVSQHVSAATADAGCGPAASVSPAASRTPRPRPSPGHRLGGTGIQARYGSSPRSTRPSNNLRAGPLLSG